MSIIKNPLTIIKSESSEDLAKLIDRTITSVTIPEGVQVVGYDAFHGCTSMTSAVFPSTLYAIRARGFQDCTALTSIELPNGFVELGTQAIYGCTNLSSVKLPNTVTTIPYECFMSCGTIGSLEIGTGITSIADRAFRSTRIGVLTIHATTPPTLGGNNGIDSSNIGYIVIYVPAESVQAYKTANNWSVFADSIQAIPE